MPQHHESERSPQHTGKVRSAVLQHLTACRLMRLQPTLDVWAESQSAASRAALDWEILTKLSMRFASTLPAVLNTLPHLCAASFWPAALGLLLLQLARLRCPMAERHWSPQQPSGPDRLH